MPNQNYMFSSSNPQETVALNTGDCLLWYSTTPLIVQFPTPDGGTQTTTLENGDQFCASFLNEYTLIFDLEIVSGCNQSSQGVAICLINPLTPVDTPDGCPCQLEREIACIKYEDKAYFGYRINRLTEQNTTLVRYEWIDFTTIPSDLEITVGYDCGCEMLHEKPNLIEEP